MRIINRKLKLILLGFFLFLFGYLSINNIDTNQIKFSLSPESFLNKKLKQKNSSKNELIATKTTLTTSQINEDLAKEIVVENESQVHRYLAYDGGGFGSVNDGVIKCSDDIEVEVTGSIDRIENADFSYFHMNAPEKIKNLKKKQYTMVYTMESEVHSYGGETWQNADFKMWYNLDQSFPEPATYFDVKKHLLDLLQFPKIEFNNKEKNSSMVWIVSNCAAYNSRESFVKKLMSKISIDSYGGCLKNKYSHSSEHMKGNIDLYSKYKFVIAIENSNCEDYITEKLVHAVASGSIPIVAGKDNKPNYLKFMPKNSYINIYDYNSIDDLVKHLKLIESNKQEYEKFIHFKRKHNYTREYLSKLSLNELINVAKTIFNYENEKHFFDGLILKEKSENKLCKIARYLKNTPESVIDAEIKQRQGNRPESSVLCLKRSSLEKDFQ